MSIVEIHRCAKTARLGLPLPFHGGPFAAEWLPSFEGLLFNLSIAKTSPRENNKPAPDDANATGERKEKKKKRRGKKEGMSVAACPRFFGSLGL